MSGPTWTRNNGNLSLLSHRWLNCWAVAEHVSFTDFKQQWWGCASEWFISYVAWKPVPVAALSGARTVFEHWNCGFESYSRHGCVTAFFCVVLSCVGRGLALGRSPVRVLPNVHRFINSEKLNSGWAQSMKPNPWRRQWRRMERIKLMNSSTACTRLVSSQCEIPNRRIIIRSRSWDFWLL
jgi:hypothetical protein